MQTEGISAGVRTVTHLAVYFDELKQAALDLAERISPQARGYFTPSEEDQARALLVSYWLSRGALLELIASCRGRIDQAPADQPADFLVAFAAALVLVDAARFLRAELGDHRVVKRKLNEPVPQFGIPGGTYDTVQRSLLSARHAWHLYHAIRFFDENEHSLRTAAQDSPLGAVMAVIDGRRHCLDVSLGRFAKTRLRVRTGQAFRGVAREVLGRALYGLQKLGMGMMADVYVRPGHTPQTPAKIFQALTGILTPGDVLIVRKEYALTNYFLPGHWPHAALYLGDGQALERLGIREHANVRPRWAQILQADRDEPRRVLESMKDGVRIRSLRSTLASDSTVVLRPQLPETEIAQALARGLIHEGKPYDFDFDFRRSDRLVCTEVIYRAYEGIGPVRFHLTRRAGRPTLSGSDLIEMGIRREHFAPVAVFAPTHADGVLTGQAADNILQTEIGVGTNDDPRRDS